MSKKDKIIRESTCGFKEPGFMSQINAYLVRKACDDYFRRKGLPVNEFTPYGSYCPKKKK